eukprot:gnl/Chilomastix_cuspidata/6157.p1 GENE.gnl/Chilomastix_cuspidata/6157~~gnl/Chilomastix_cuspidata/6157.p1  ORF type:complete len:326 (-),score=39.62 gnl/Chilomastix_cuspidata/6157:109-1086(-)
MRGASPSMIPETSTSRSLAESYESRQFVGSPDNDASAFLDLSYMEGLEDTSVEMLTHALAKTHSEGKNLHIQSMRSITALSLRGCGMQRLTLKPGALPVVRYLYLDANNLCGEFNANLPFPGLRVLSVCANRITAIARLERLAHLEELRADHNNLVRLRDVSCACALPSLRRISLLGNPLRAPLDASALAPFSGLTALAVSAGAARSADEFLRTAGLRTTTAPGALEVRTVIDGEHLCLNVELQRAPRAVSREPFASSGGAFLQAARVDHPEPTVAQRGARSEFDALLSAHSRRGLSTRLSPADIVRQQCRMSPACGAATPYPNA